MKWDMKCKECGQKLEKGNDVPRRKNYTGVKYFCNNSDCPVIFALVSRQNIRWIYEAKPIEVPLVV